MDIGIEVGRVCVGATLTNHCFLIENPQSYAVLLSREGMRSFLSQIPETFAAHMGRLVLCAPKRFLREEIKGWALEWGRAAKIGLQDVALVETRESLHERWVSEDRVRRHRAHAAGLLVGAEECEFFLVRSGRINDKSKFELAGQGIGSPLDISESGDFKTTLLQTGCLGQAGAGDQREFADRDVRLAAWAQSVWEQISFRNDWPQDPQFPILVGGVGANLLIKYLVRATVSPLWPIEQFHGVVAQGAILKAFARGRNRRVQSSKKRLIVQIKDEKILEDIYSFPKNIRGKIVENSLKNCLSEENRQRFLSEL